MMEYRLVLAGFGGDHERGRHAYARFIEEGVKDGISSPWEQLTGQVLLGLESFVAMNQWGQTRLSIDQKPGNSPAPHAHIDVAQGLYHWTERCRGQILTLVSL
jgi:hypothetical protein